MTITLELKFCQSKCYQGIERQEGHQGTKITSISTRPDDLFLIPYFDRFLPNFQNEAYSLSVNRGPK